MKCVVRTGPGFLMQFFCLFSSRLLDMNQKYQSKTQFQFRTGNNNNHSESTTVHSTTISNNGAVQSSSTTRVSNAPDGRTLQRTENRFGSDVTASLHELSLFKEEYAQIAAKYFRRFSPASTCLKSGCLFSSIANVQSEPKGADVVDGGSSARTPSNKLQGLSSVAGYAAPKSVPVRNRFFPFSEILENKILLRLLCGSSGSNNGLGACTGSLISTTTFSSSVQFNFQGKFNSQN
jgi:hypothetical protein